MVAIKVRENITQMWSARTLLMLGLMISISFIVACDDDGKTAITDVTSNPKYRGGYNIKSVYVLQQDLFILSINGHQAELFIPDRQNTGIELANYQKIESPSLADYKANPKKWPYLIGIAPKGSHIRLDKIELYSTTTNSQLDLHGQIITDEFKGKDVLIQSLSFAVGEGLALSPDEKYLKIVEEPKTTTSSPAKK